MADDNIPRQKYEDLDRDYQALDILARQWEAELGKVKQKNKDLERVHSHCANPNLARDFQSVLKANTNLNNAYQYEVEERKRSK